jgi:hypothetical protein
MQKLYFLLFVLVANCTVVIAQSEPLSAKDKALLDSMMENDEFLKLMKGGKKRNTLDIEIGIGNRAFSSENQAVNATSILDQLIFTPSVVYNTKSGFGFGITGFATSDSLGNLQLYQTGLSAVYEYYGKEIFAGLSYTRYLSDVKKYNNKSLYQNDIYGYIKKARGIIQPGIAMGYANGNYKEVSVASFVLNRPLNPRGDTTIIGKDSTDNKTSYFSLSGSIDHDFSFYKLFSKGDELDFTPSLIINFGSDKNTQTHTNKLFNRPALSKRKRVEFSNKFQLQSVAASFDFTYSVGKFYLQPNLYLDYYLPETTAKRLSTIFSVTAGFSL